MTADTIAVEPHFGRTRLRTAFHPHGLPVHLHAIDHMPTDTAYQRFNKRVALWLTKNVGSMTAFWLFTLLAGCVAPSCLYTAGYIHLKAFYTTFGFNLLATLILSTWLELALMPAIMVGQNIMSAAADARQVKTFEMVSDAHDDIKKTVSLLDVNTEGGLKDLYEKLTTYIDAKFDALPKGGDV